MSDFNHAAGGNKSTETFVFMFGMILLMVAVFHFGHDYIVYGILQLSALKLHVLAFFGNENAALAATKIGTLGIHSETIKNMGYSTVISIDSYSSKWFAWPLAIALMFLAGSVFLSSPNRKYRRVFNLQRLVENQAKSFPAIRPIIGLDLLKESTETGAWRTPDDYIRFSMNHELLLMPALMDGVYQGRKVRKGEPITLHEIYRGKLRPVTTKKRIDRSKIDLYRFDVDRANEVFTQQLGLRIFESNRVLIKEFAQWPKQVRALMLVFAIVVWGGDAVDARNTAMHFLIQFNNGFYESNYRKKGKKPLSLDQLDMSGVDEWLAKFLGVKFQVSKPYVFPDGIKQPRITGEGIKQFRQMFVSYAYLNTIMIALLERSRTRGILVTADFVWLRPIDRTLFYTLNNVGRNNPKNATIYAEGGGSMAHFMVEDTRGCATPNPEVSEAVTGLIGGLVKEGWLSQENAGQSAFRG
jgi:intracellular multiplication protein IcmP